MELPQIVVLAIIQGLAELLPVSSSAHVIIAEKLMGLDPSSPRMTLLLVMLHTGTMFAAIVYFWSAWRATYFASWRQFVRNALHVATATAATGIVGLILLRLVRHLAAGDSPDFEIEALFGNARLIAAALVAAGLLIIVASRRDWHARRRIGLIEAASIGAVQGLCLPFRGFSRSGATISAGLMLGVSRRRAEEFSFALAVVLTPPIIVRELLRLLHADAAGIAPSTLGEAIATSLFGALIAFGAGLIALRWLTRWLEHGRWHLFGIYCLAAAGAVLWIG
jgi:undecaprenyl-diphosphatase